MISANQIKKGFKQWKERTSTSPSNRHPGHYKSLLVADGKKGMITRGWFGDLADWRFHPRRTGTKLCREIV